MKNRLLLPLIDKALEAVDPETLVLRCVARADKHLIVDGEKFDLSEFSRIHVLGIGKGAPFLFRGIRKVMGHRISGGIIVTIAEHSGGNYGPGINVIPAAHPVPDSTSQAAGDHLYDYACREIGEKDLVIFLLTGGASSLIMKPVPGVSPDDISQVNRLLLNSGADITEINCIRKHLSQLKGGRLAQLVAPARMITLVLSDVVGSPLEDIGSGPGAGDGTTFKMARDVLKRYSLWSKVSHRVRAYLEKGIRGEVLETPGPEEISGAGHRHFLIGDNRTALWAVRETALGRGIPCRILTSGDRGEASEIAKVYAAVLRETAAWGEPFTRPVLLLAGGELTVTVKGRGKGGRNQEFMLHMLRELRDPVFPFYLASFGSDGRDGPTDAAGAWIDHTTFQKARRKGLGIGSYLAENDSYRFFAALGQLIKTGPTRTNVMDIRLFYLP